MGQKDSKEKKQKSGKESVLTLKGVEKVVKEVSPPEIPVFTCCHTTRGKSRPHADISRGLGTLQYLPLEIIATIVLYLPTNEIVHTVGLTCYSGWFVVFQQSIVDIFLHLWQRELSHKALPAGDIPCSPCTFLTEFNGTEERIRRITIRLSQLQKVKSDREAVTQETVRHYKSIQKLIQWIKIAVVAGIFFQAVSWSWWLASFPAWYIHQSVFSWGESCKVSRPNTVFDVSECLLLILWAFAFLNFSLPTLSFTTKKERTRIILVHGGIGVAFLLFAGASCYVPFSLLYSTSKLLWFIPTIVSIALAVVVHTVIWIGSALVCSYAVYRFIHLFAKPVEHWIDKCMAIEFAKQREDLKEVEIRIHGLTSVLQKLTSSPKPPDTNGGRIACIVC